ncbi:MAG: hemerythrin domain-containing protein, partial [Acidimicrobiia bacterium]
MFHGATGMPWPVITRVCASRRARYHAAPPQRFERTRLMADPVVLLKKDHREAEALLKTLAASKPGARRKATLKKLDAALRLHMKIEEVDLYPTVAKLLGKEDVTEANIEHDLARDGLDKMHELVDKPGFGAAVAMVTAGIKHHVKEEETEMFPDLKRKL